MNSMEREVILWHKANKEFLDKFALHFKKISSGANIDKIAVAVSGGIDSIALLLLVLFCAQNHNPMRIYVLHVNHNFRKESKEDQKLIATLCNNLGLELICFSLEKKVKLGNAQEFARNWRYNMMSKFCNANNIELLLTGHHLNDLMESYLFRTNRKSGEFGLFSDITFHVVNDVLVVRPLLIFYKKELKEFLNCLNIKWIEDETNSLDIYSRNKIRQQIEAMDMRQIEEISNEMSLINIQARNMQKQLIAAIAKYLIIDNFGTAKIFITKLFNEDFAVLLGVINFAVVVVGGADSIPRHRTIKNILDKLQKGEDFNINLAGIVAFSKNDALYMKREYNAITAKTYELKHEFLWDQRFLINAELLPQEKLNDLTITCLSLEDYVACKKDILDCFQRTNLVENYKKNIIFTFPVIKRLEKLVAIPHISYYNSLALNEVEIENLKNSLLIYFKPRFVSRFLHLYLGE